MNYDRRTGAIEYKPLTPEVRAKIAAASKEAGTAATHIKAELASLKSISDAVLKVLEAHYGHRGGVVEAQGAPSELSEFLWRTRQLKHVMDPEMFDPWKLVYAIATLRDTK